MSGAPPLLYVETLGPEPDGRAETFVLIHGYGATMFTWRHWAPRLAQRGQVVLVDIKGHGRAAKPDDGRYSPADQAELVHRLIVERGLDGVTLVGHSLGGGIALLTALRMLDAGEGRLARLVIVAGPAYQQRLPPFVWLAHRPRLATLGLRLIGPRRVIRRVLRSIVYDPGTTEESQVEAYSAPLRQRATVRALFAAARQIVPPDLAELTARYPEIDVPVLLIWGRHDRVVPLSTGLRLAEELPNARMEILERCGHVPPEELPEESYRIVEGFLDGPLSGAGTAHARA